MPRTFADLGLSFPLFEAPVEQAVTDDAGRTQGIVLEDVYVIPRSTLRGVNRIYLIDPEGPKIRKAQIEPLWSNAETLIVRDGLAAGDWLATSRLPYAPDGAPVEIVEPKIAAEDADASTASKASGS